MFIDFEVLRDKGWHVEPQKDGVLIHGDKPADFYPALVKTLNTLGLKPHQSETLVEDLAIKVETQMIFNDLT